MRLPEEQIKQAILHLELPVRTLALHYFSRSFSDNTTVMPMVVEAVEKYGRQESIHLVGEGENLPQTESTIQWCLEELRRDFGEQDENLDNYRYALSKVLTSADPSLTLTKESHSIAVRRDPNFASGMRNLQCLFDWLEKRLNLCSQFFNQTVYFELLHGERECTSIHV